MVSLANDLRSHVTWGSTGIVSIIWFNFSWYSKVSDSQVATVIDDKILGFQVPVNDLFAVEVFEAEDDAG